MNIIISKSEVYKEVQKMSALAGSMLSVDNSPKYEDVLITDNDGEVIDTFWRDGVSSAVQLFIRYVSNETVDYDLTSYNDTEELLISADMPDAFNDQLTGSIATSTKMMLACNVMAGWMGIKYPDLAKKYKEDALGYAADIKKKLLFRSSPAQNRFTDFKSDTDVSLGDDFFEEKSVDTNAENGPDYFGTKSNDTDKPNVDDFFEEKSSDTDISATVDFFSEKPSETSVSPVDDYMVTKEDDNLILEQYEDCNIDPA